VSKPKGNSPRRSVDIGARTLAEYEEARRRSYHAGIRRELIERGALVDNSSVEKALEEAVERKLKDGGCSWHHIAQEQSSRVREKNPREIWP
jgi:hypothetical protein